MAPADLVPDMRLTSLGGDRFAWPVTPLTDLLTQSDMERLLGEPAAVAAWCRQQLCRPPAERPAGLTAELNTPRGRAELLLQPELFLRAVSEAVPGGRAVWQRRDQETGGAVESKLHGHIPPTSSAGRWLELPLFAVPSGVPAPMSSARAGRSDGRRHGPPLAAEHAAPAVR